MTFALAVEALDVIYVNLWAILISIANLLIIFLILKRFLFKPVTRVVSKREEMIAASMQDAEDAKVAANADREAYAARLANAEEDATEVIRRATVSANRTGEEIVADAERRAATLLRKADEDIAQEKRRALNDMKNEVSDISLTIAEKIVEREIDAEDHRALIDTFIREVGETDE